ncbi:M48 family metalloprotease, partial [Streptomyces sp. NPDC058045]|uniref:M48 family metalloprotease n=1 Tax=Streptomyces sp. NPDC058045 TaxID=3346311 RepID=UPI0036E673A9
MTALLLPLLAPLLLPCALPLLARGALRRLSPVAALWALTATALVLGAAAVAALGGLLLTGLLKLPPLAALGHFVHPLRTPSDLLVLPAAGLAAGALAVSTWTLARSGRLQIRALRTARRAVAARPAAGDLCVLESPHPDAYALPGRPHRIVVTTAMLRSLGADEREVLFAHERAHNRGGHHFFLAAAELAAHCHP